MHQNFLEVPETHRNISRPFGSIYTPMGRVPAPKNQAKLSNYMGEGRSISQLLLGPHAPTFLEVSETHRNTSTPPTGC